MNPVPSGTVTFLFTDIEGSTRRWEAHGARMGEAVRRHDDLVRNAIESNGGHVFKTVGDAFCSAFAQSADALRAALDLQRALAAADFSAVDGLRVRAALHAGTAEERGGDYFGPTVNRAARLLSTGHGEQIILSATAHELCASAAPPQIIFTDLGAHRLKDLSRSEQVFQVVAPGLRSDFPPLRSLSTVSNNLPVVRASFVGREAEIGEARELLARGRLVTLVGSGGVGKTRTSLEIAAGLIDQFGDGVWIAEFAPLSDPTLVPRALANALGVELLASDDATQVLLAALRSKSALLLFDNCEHVIEAAARLAATLLDGAPRLRILATSRQALGVAGEEVFRLPPLDVPSETEAARLTAERAREFGAIALFVERARSTNKSFTVTDQIAPALAEIVRRLDGIPLAIELAAARVGLLDVPQLRKRLDERFRLLTGGNRDALPRQQTLRATIDWSYDLLDERERALFRRAGVFVVGFDLDAAGAVCTGEGVDEADVLDILGSLVDKSLVAADVGIDATRYRLLESTRAYALEKLDAVGELPATENVRLAWYTQLAEAAYRQTEATLKRDLWEHLERDVANIRAALRWTQESGQFVAGAHLLRRYIDGLDPSVPESTAYLDSFIERLPADHASLLAALNGAYGNIRSDTMRITEGLMYGERAVAHARESGEAEALARRLVGLAVLLTRGRRLDEARAALAEAQALGVTDLSCVSYCVYHNMQGFVADFEGRALEAKRSYELVIERYESLGVTGQDPSVYINLAEAEFGLGNTERAIAVVRMVLPRAKSYWRANLLTNLAGYLLRAGDITEGRAAALESLELANAGDPDGVLVAIAMEQSALAMALQGEIPSAARLLGYTSRRFEEAGFQREATESATYERLRGLLLEHLAPGELEGCAAEGRTFSPERARREASPPPSA